MRVRRALLTSSDSERSAGREESAGESAGQSAERGAGESAGESAERGVGHGGGRSVAAATFGVSLSAVLTEEAVAAHLARMLEADMERAYGGLLPPGVAPRKDDILRVVRSGFFHHARDELGDAVAETPGALLARTLGYEYAGEGVEAFVRGLRRL